MNPFLMTPSERLTDWRRLRKSLAEMERPAQLVAIAEYWAQAPLMKMAYDIEEIEKIPGPWEMISAGDWCRDSVAIGMEFTLRLAGWKSDELSLEYIRDYDISEQMLTLKIDTGQALNYCVGDVTEITSSRHDVLRSWRHNGRIYCPEI